MAGDLQRLLADAGVPLEAVRGLDGGWSAEAIGLGDLRLCCVQVVVGSQQGDLAFFELVWLPARDGFEPVALFPGLLIAGVLRDYRAVGVMIDMRLEKARKAFAALALLCSGDRFPFAAEAPVPLTEGTELRTAWAQDAWRPWRTSTGPEGTYVELPWIEGDRLLRGKVLVPETGFETSLAERVDTIASGQKWAIPTWIALAEGRPRMLRFLRQVGST